VSRNHVILYGATFLCAAILTGCGIGTISTSDGGGTMSLQGKVHGGQQGVVGAVVQLYTVGVSGNGTAAIPILKNTVTTGADGYFSITKDYTCGEDSSGSPLPTGASNQVYLVATGGDPGVGSNNPALVMVSALGSCSALTSASSVYVNEVTTVAAAWALAQFASSADNIAASATNSTGVINAFLDANLLANSHNGALATLPSNLSVEAGKINGLADALASCVNSDGGSACTPLFSAATEGSVPADTFTAALNIVKNPGKNVAKVFNAIGTYVPFPTTLSKSPNDWTMSLTVTGSGLSAPTDLALDSEGDVWVANEYGPLSAFNPQGTPLSDNGFGAGDLLESFGIAVDTSDNVWVTNYNAVYNPKGGSVSKFYGVSSSLGSPGTAVLDGSNPGFTDDIDYPYAVAADTNGNMFVANNGNSSATVLTASGAVSSGYLGESLGLYIYPDTIAVDTNHGFWTEDENYSVYHIAADGTLLSATNCCDYSYGVATDKFGNVWVTSYYGDALSEVGSDGTLLVPQSKTGGLKGPELDVIDGAQNVWAANYFGSSVSVLAGSGGTLAAGTAISPSTGVYGTGGYGLDAQLGEPVGIAPDRSGNLWVSNYAVATVTMFFGIAAPTATPIQSIPTAP
jgi:hypothetical protein